MKDIIKMIAFLILAAVLFILIYNLSFTIWPAGTLAP
jgi:hypothetical protein